MDFLGENAYLVSTTVQVLAYLALAVVALTRLGRVWAVLALLGALASLVPTLWYFAANLTLRFDDPGMDSYEFFYSAPAQILMQVIGAIGLLLIVAAVLVGRGPRKEAPVEGPTGTTFRQLPSDITWK